MNYLNYFLEANLGLLFFYCAYWLLLRNENQFSIQRFILLAGVILSFLFPLIHLNDYLLPSQPIVPSLGESIPSNLLPELIVSGNNETSQESTSSLSYWRILTWIYVFVVSTLSVWLIYRISQVLSLISKAKKFQWNGLIVYEVNQEFTAFSFFRLIFIGNKNLTETDKGKILAHEAVHVEKLHSCDIIVLQVVRILFWFNPIVKLYQKAIMQLHEFEADSKAVSDEETDDYCLLLAKTALQSSGISLTNHFSNSLYSRRIAMLKTFKTKIRSWKLIGVSLLMLMVFGVIGCQDQLEGKKSLSDGEFPVEIKNHLEKIRAEFPTAEIEVSEYGKENKDFKATQFNLIYTKHKKYIILVKDNRLRDYPKNESFVFNSYVDEKAKPLGGMEAFYSQLTHAIIYPQNAIQNGYEEKVFVEFIVNTNGKLSDIKVIKGKYESLNLEAERVLLQMGGTWTPAINLGKIVRQKLILPITFSLPNPNVKNGNVRISPPHSFNNMNVSFSTSNVSGGKKIEGFISDTYGKPLGEVSIIVDGQLKLTTSGEEHFSITTNSKSGTIEFKHPVFRSSQHKY